MAELAPDFTPYRYGFNNPVFWEDSTGLFESRDAAQQWINRWGLSGAEISYNWDKGFYEILSEGVSFHQQGEDIIRTMYEWSDTNGGTVSYSTIKGGAGNVSQSKKSDGGFWKFWEMGGMFNVYGKMKDDPGFTPNSRKRGAVDVSMNFDEAYERGKTSMMTLTDWFKRYKDLLGGLDSRLSTLGERMNTTESDDKIKMQYNSWNVYENGSWIYEYPYITKSTNDTMIHNNQLQKTNLKNLEIRDSIIKYKLYEKSINDFKNK